MIWAKQREISKRGTGRCPSHRRPRRGSGGTAALACPWAERL